MNEIKKPNSWPMFEDRSNKAMAILADKLHVGIPYLIQVREGHRTISPKTKGVWASLAKSSVQKMFGDEE